MSRLPILCVLTIFLISLIMLAHNVTFAQESLKKIVPKEKSAKAYSEWLWRHYANQIATKRSGKAPNLFPNGSKIFLPKDGSAPSNKGSVTCNKDDSEPSNSVTSHVRKNDWLTDYQKATQEAKTEEKMLLIYFTNEKEETSCKKFESETLEDEEIKNLLDNYVLLRLPMDAKIGEEVSNPIEQVGFVSKNKEMESKETQKKLLSENHSVSPFSVQEISSKTSLLSSPPFTEMLNTPGLAVIDYKNKDADYYAQVVSVFPFLNKKPYNIFETKTILKLPPGSVTQRSMIYAVRVHPEKPKSTDGELNEMLENEAKSHSLYQAKIHVQGHHNWDSRFQRITAKLPGEIWASEVCAESWPGQHLLESAIECVRCWRLSSGHWSAVVAEHPYYGYDMKRGSNGVWYATGIFGKWKKPGSAKTQNKNKNG